jgi:transposase
MNESSKNISLKDKAGDAKQQRLAIMEVLGMSPKQMRTSMHNSPQTIYRHRQEAHSKGYVQELQEKMKDQTSSLLEERKILAERCFKIVNKKANSILDRSEDEEIKLKDAEFALKAIGETEHSGRKVDAPKVTINVKKEATLNIQQNLNDISKILERSGIDLEALVGG